MRYFLLLLLYTAGVLNSAAQVSRQPSGNFKEDTARINYWIDYGLKIAWKKPDSAIIIYHQLLTQSLSIHYDRGYLLTLRALGVAYRNTGKIDSSLYYDEKGIDFGKNKPAHSDIVETLYNNIAAIYSDLGEKKDAAENYYKVIRLAELSGNKFSLVQAYNNLAPILAELGEYSKAMSYLDQAINTLSSFKNEKERDFLLPFLYINKAAVLQQLNMPEEAKAFCKLTIKLGLNNKNRQTDLICSGYILWGNIYRMEKNNDLAMIYHQKALDIAAGYPYLSMQAYVEIARDLLESKRYGPAENNLNKALAIAGTLNTKPELAEIHKSLADLYTATGRYAEAVKNMNVSSQLKDSIMSAASMRSINLMEAKYNAAKKDKEIAEKKFTIAQQQASIMKQNIWIWSTSALFVIIITSLVIFYFNRQKLQKHREQITAWQSITEGEEKERTRIARDLHDGIGGLLANVKMYFSSIQKANAQILEIHDYKLAMEMLENTLKEVRQTAHNLMPELLLRHGLTEAVRMYCLNTPAGSDLKINFQYYGFLERLNPSFELAIYRIIQELVQNVLKHSRATLAIVQLSQHNNILNITVEDNGMGMDKSKLENVSGVGLQSIRRRTAHLNGSFNFESTPGKGTTAYLEFNLQTPKQSKYEYQGNHS